MYCEVCTTPFMEEFKLSDHIKRVHPELLLTCDFCDRTFGTKQTLSYHMDEFHENEATSVKKPFVCSVNFCQKRFQHEASIKKHTKYSHFQRHVPDDSYEGRKPRDLAAVDEETRSPCAICGKLILSSKMNCHLRTHDSHSCKQCGKVFKRRSSLKQHELVQHLKVKLTCPVEGCGRTFQSRTALKSHLGYKHGDTSRHKCDQCEKSFLIKHDLLTHVRGVHEGIKAYCSFCRKDFIRPSERNRHEKQVHGAAASSRTPNDPAK